MITDHLKMRENCKRSFARYKKYLKKSSEHYQRLATFGEEDEREEFHPRMKRTPDRTYRIEIFPDFPMSDSKRSRSCVVAAVSAFAIGFVLGIAVPFDSDARPRLRYALAETEKAPFETADIKKNNASAVTFLVEDFGKVDNDDDDGVIFENIYWGTKVERLLPEGFGSGDGEEWSEYASKGNIVELAAGCGRTHNRMATFSDGRRACVRYRQNLDQIQGEMFCYLLARMLAIPNLPPSTVALVNLTRPLWRSVAAETRAADWSPDRPVVVTRFLPGLESAPIPAQFRRDDRRLDESDVADAVRASGDPSAELVSLAQWSDLIVFDYLTANLDRLVNNLYNRQWNERMMEAPAHNLALHSASRLLVFLDNESGLLHGYRLLAEYEPLHRALLRGLCVFRRTTVAALTALHHSGAAADTLYAAFTADADADLLDALPPLSPGTASILQDRLAALVAHVDACRRRHRHRQRRRL